MPIHDESTLIWIAKSFGSSDLQPLGNSGGPLEPGGHRFVRRAIELPELREDFDFARGSIGHVDSELDASGVACAWVETVTPLKPRFALGTG